MIITFLASLFWKFPWLVNKRITSSCELLAIYGKRLKASTGVYKLEDFWNIVGKYTCSTYIGGLAGLRTFIAEP